MNNLGLTEEQVNDLLYENSVLDENEEESFQFISKKFYRNDTEKSHVDYTVVIKDCKSGKFYKAILGESPWYLQEESNANQEWTEVKPKRRVKTDYE